MSSQRTIVFIPTYDYFSHKLFRDMARAWPDVRCHYCSIEDTSIRTSWDFPDGEYPYASRYRASTVYRGIEDTEALYREMDLYCNKVKPDIVLSPSDALDIHIITAKVLEQRGVRLCTLQPAFLNLHEGFPGERPKIYGAESCDVLCVWSAFWADICRRNGSTAAMRVVGCHDFDRMHEVLADRAVHAGRIRARTQDPDTPRPIVSLFLPHDEETGMRFLQKIRRTVHRNPQLLFVVKPHPRHRDWGLGAILCFPNVKLALPRESDEELLAASDATVSVMSYTSLKAMMIGLPSIIFRDPPIDHPFFDGSPSILLAWTDDFDTALSRSLRPDFAAQGAKRLHRYLEYMIGCTETGYMDRLRAVIEEFAAPASA